MELFLYVACNSNIKFMFEKNTTFLKSVSMRYSVTIEEHSFVVTILSGGIRFEKFTRSRKC